MSLESYNNLFNSVAESAGEAAGAAVGAGALGAAGVGAGTGAVEGVVENVQDFSWVGDENKNDGGYHLNEVKEEPKMTVDEVYGKANQSIVESQGDYSASSNEKSNVETNTFGKQDDISVTPVSVTENKGIVNNSTIQSVEGLNFQQKDKASQDVLDSRKKRDEAEAEDKSNQMRDKIKAAVTETKEEPSEDVKDFQVGKEAASKEKAALDEAKDRFIKISNEYKAKLKEQDNINKAALAAINEVEAINNEYNAKVDSLLNNKANPDEVEAVTDEHMSKLVEVANKYGVDTSSLNTNQTYDVSTFITNTLVNKSNALDSELDNLSKKQAEAKKAFKEAEYAYNNAFNNEESDKKQDQLLSQEQNIKNLAAERNKADKIYNEEADKLAEIGGKAAYSLQSLQDMSKAYNETSEGLLARNAPEDEVIKNDNNYISELQNLAKENNIDTSSWTSNKVSDLESIVSNGLEKIANDAHNRMQELRSKTDELDSEYKQAVVAHNKDFNENHTWYDTALDAINNSTASEEEKAAASEALTKVDDSISKVTKAAEKLTESLDNVSDDDINTFMDSLKELNKNYEDANDKVNFFKRTDFNKQYVTSIAKANDFDVTLADGSKMSFSEFSTKMATKSPRIAEAMYNAKADRLEQEGHPVLAKMERNKAKMVGNWFGSKFTFADDLVRNQFNQMAETNMRATYAAYNNVLNDPNATPEQKNDAKSQIQQANSLMTASAALKASTGFWSGIGDGMGDGTYGTTDPKTLNAYQKTLNTINNFTKVVLGLGVTPGANRAYENMYYLAGDDVDKSALFNKDFNSDGFALCQEYGNSATAGMIAGAGELSTGVALLFNPSTMGMGANLIGDSVGTFLDGLYGVAIDVNKSEDYTRAVLGYFEDAKDIAEKSINVDAGNEEAVAKITTAISQIENFRLGSEEANSFDNWLEGSGSNTADNGKFNQALTYEEWLKLIEADPTMQEYAKKLIAEKKNAKESNADAGVNS